MKNLKLLIPLLLFFSFPGSASAHGLSVENSEYKSLSCGNKKLHSDTYKHKTEVTIINDSYKMIYWLEEHSYGLGFDYFIFPGDGITVYSDDNVCETVHIVLKDSDHKVAYDNYVPNHSTIRASEISGLKTK